MDKTWVTVRVKGKKFDEKLHADLIRELIAANNQEVTQLMNYMSMLLATLAVFSTIAVQYITADWVKTTLVIVGVVVSLAIIFIGFRISQVTNKNERMLMAYSVVLTKASGCRLYCIEGDPTEAENYLKKLAEKYKCKITP